MVKSQTDIDNSSSEITHPKWVKLKLKLTRILKKPHIILSNRNIFTIYYYTEKKVNMCAV